MQQDANEFYVELVNDLRQRLKLPGDSNKNFVNQFMGIQLASKVKCLESEDEPVKEETEQLIQLSCFINQTVTHIFSGLKSKLTETIVKKSSLLDRDANYQKSSLLNRIPAYLSVQVVRFSYKQSKGVNAKILKDIKFAFELDLFDVCTPELQKKLGPVRGQLKDEDDRKALAVKNRKIKGEDAERVDPNKKIDYKPFSFEEDIGSSNSGKYSLEAVLTHKGRDSSSGHYIGWVKKADDYWFKCDDDNIQAVTNEEILKLSGGGDWHMAYLLFYKSRSPEASFDSKDQLMDTNS
jgi:ubiquitin carboxyl-terminal hydrolase 14